MERFRIITTSLYPDHTISVQLISDAPGDELLPETVAPSISAALYRQTQVNTKLLTENNRFIPCLCYNYDLYL